MLSQVKVSCLLKLPDGFSGSCSTVSSQVIWSAIVADVNDMLKAESIDNPVSLVSTQTPTASTACNALGPVKDAVNVATAPAAGSTSSIGLYAGAGGGALLLLAAVGLGIWWYRRRKEKLRKEQQERDFQPTWSYIYKYGAGKELEVKWRAVDAYGNTATKFSEMVREECLSIYELAETMGCVAPRPALSPSASPQPNASGDPEAEPETVIDLDEMAPVLPASVLGGGQHAVPYSASPRRGSPVGSPRRSRSSSPRTPRSNRSRRTRSRSPRNMPQSYFVHEFVEYFSIKYQRWTLGWIFDGDGRNESIILYQAIVGPKLDLRRLVPMDILRRPFLKDEPIWVQGRPHIWYPAAVLRGCPVTIDHRRYSVRVQWSGKVIHKVPGIYLTRRYPVDSVVYVFLNPMIGWRKGIVLKEEGGPIPVVRPKYFEAEKMPRWTLLTVSLEVPLGTDKVIKVASYLVSRKDYTVGPKPFPASQLTGGLIPPLPYDEEDYGPDEDETPSPFDFSASVEHARQLLQACLSPRHQPGTELVVERPVPWEEVTIGI